MIERIIIISLIVCGVKIVIQEGYVFEKIGLLLQKIFSKKYIWSSPFWNCVICMNSVYGTAAYFLLWGYDWKWFVVIFACIPVTAFIHDHLKEWFDE